MADQHSGGASDRVLKLATITWPDGVPGQHDWLLAAGFSRAMLASPQLQVDTHDDQVCGVHWFEAYPTGAEPTTAQEHLVARVTDGLGTPVDRTADTACWRTEKFQVEVYAHHPKGRARAAVHQFAVLPLPLADHLERLDRERGRQV